MNGGGHSIQQTEGHSNMLYKMVGFYKKMGGATKLLKKENNYFQTQTSVFGWKQLARVFITQIASSFRGGGAKDRVQVINHLIHVDQKKPDFFIKIFFFYYFFQERLKEQLDLGIKSRYGIMDFHTIIPFWVQFSH